MSLKTHWKRKPHKPLYIQNGFCRCAIDAFCFPKFTDDLLLASNCYSKVVYLISGLISCFIHAEPPNCFPTFRTFVGGSHLTTYRGTAPYISADYILFIDSSNSLVACSVHGTNLPSENQYDGLEELRSRTASKRFQVFLCKIAVSVCRRLHRNAATGRSPCVPVFPGCQRSFPPSEREREEVPESSPHCYGLCGRTVLAKGMGLEPIHPFGLLPV